MTSSIPPRNGYLRPSGPVMHVKVPPPLTPLPPQTHTLTPPLSAQSHVKPNGTPSPSTSATSLPQTQSPLLSLPLELRLQIYTALLGGPDVPVHIARTPTHLVSIRCWMPHIKRYRWHGCQGRATPNGLFVGWPGPNKEFGFGNDEGRMAVGMQGMLPLLQTCRLVYAEAILLLYKTPMFIINNVKVLLGWRDCVLAKSFAAVRALDLRISMGMIASEYLDGSAGDDDWRRFWRAGGGMESLKLLRVTLKSGMREYYWEDEMEMLEPLEQFRQVPDFEVLVNWRLSVDKDGSAVDEKKQRPFKLLRC